MEESQLEKLFMQFSSRAPLGEKKREKKCQGRGGSQDSLRGSYVPEKNPGIVHARTGGAFQQQGASVKRERWRILLLYLVGPI